VGHHHPVKKKIVKKPPRNSSGFCGGDQGLSWAVEPKKEEGRYYEMPQRTLRTASG
jgi:hypothetical protein